jgi:hypothetical protein
MKGEHLGEFAVKGYLIPFRLSWHIQESLISSPSYQIDAPGGALASSGGWIITPAEVQKNACGQG